MNTFNRFTILSIGQFSFTAPEKCNVIRDFPGIIEARFLISRCKTVFTRPWIRLYRCCWKESCCNPLPISLLVSRWSPTTSPILMASSSLLEGMTPGVIGTLIRPIFHAFKGRKSILMATRLVRYPIKAPTTGGVAYLI